MAKVPDSGLATSSKERDGFLRDLQHFHETKGTPFKRCPTVGGQEVDLFLLYSLVTTQGGWIKVNSKNAWSDLLVHFKLPSNCVNGGVALKHIYLRFLDSWEKAHYIAEEGDRGDDEESRHKRWSAKALHSVPLTYNYSQHSIVEANREYNHLSADLYKQSDYDRLALSLISPLPNEQDFAINVCTLLSNDGKHTLKLEKHPRIINFLLGHAGVFQHRSLRKLISYSYSTIRKHPIHDFWNDILESKEYIDLTKEEEFSNKVITGPKIDYPKKKLKTKKATNSNSPEQENEKSNGETPMEVDHDCSSVGVTTNNNKCEVSDEDSDCEIVNSELLGLPKDLSVTISSKEWTKEPSDSELFCLGRTLGTQEYIGQRVIQIATILRNFSFIEENISILVKNKTFLRFLLLCCTSQWCHLKSLGLDMLGNLAPDLIIKDFKKDKLSPVLLKIVTNGLRSNDRMSCISSLEVLNKLSQNALNEETLLKHLEAPVYEKVCSFLTIHDVMLLIYTLECLYSLSSLGERSCNFIVNNHGVVDTLVSLVTVEGKSYGPKACIGMKLVETVSGIIPITSTTATSNNQSSSPTTSANTSSTNNSSSSTFTTTVLTTAAPIVTSTPATKVTVTPQPKVVPQVTSTPIRPVPIAPQRISVSATAQITSVSVSTPTTSAVLTTMTPQQLIQQQHAHQQAIHENEQFALAWLRATYEPVLDGKIDHQELYKHYLNSCSKIGRRGVISPLHFPRCVRSVFGGTVGPNPVKSSNQNEQQQFYEGIKVRAQPLVINIPQSVSTPPKSQSTTTTTIVKSNNRRKNQPQVVAIQPPTISVNSDSNESLTALSPASPILKAQLSAPPKQREIVAPATTKIDSKSQVMAHPHLSQALLGSGSASTTSTSLTTSISKEQQLGQSNTSLIKSLLATKVNDCMTTVSMRTTTDCQNVAQVAARQQQQRLLAQHINTVSTPDTVKQNILSKMETPKSSRVNGATRQLFSDGEIGDPSVSSTTQFTSSLKGKKEPPQPPPPPLVPLSTNKSKSPRIDNEDSDSIGNNSLASSSGIGTVGIGGISSTEDGDNSLTSFEGLLNGVPNMDNPLNEDSNSKDSVKIIGTNEITKNKPLRLADLLEKKIDKSTPPILNGTVGKELRLGEKTLDLVENHIEKVLSRDSDPITNINTSVEIKEEPLEKVCVKRPATEDLFEQDAKKPLLINNSVNGGGSSSSAASPAPESVTSSNGDEGPATVSTAAAKLFADMAADILEDEDEEQLLQEAQAPTNTVEQTSVIHQGTSMQQIVVENNQQMLFNQSRQIIVSQAQNNQVMISQGTPMKTQSGQTVIVQSSGQQRPVVLQQGNTGQFLLSQSIQGPVQLLASSTNPGQYVLQTSGTQGYMVAQPQTAVVHGQPQTVLVAQTAQQQGTSAKTIIILQQQTPSNSATHHQKVVVTPQGQQVVVTQVPRPVIHTSQVSNNNVSTATVIKSNPVMSTIVASSYSTGTSTTTLTQAGFQNSKEIAVVDIKKEEPKQQRTSIVRDLSTPFVCEWGNCSIETKFKSANQVYLHVCEAHCPKGSEEIMCQWERCDSMKRKRFSLMTHLHDKHCNTESMRQSLIRRKQTAHGNKVEPPPPAPTTPHPGYAPDAALHAIKRHALEFVNPKELQLKATKVGVSSAPVPVVPRPGPPPAEQDDNEGPVTKSIRLTASLILRNLVIYSSNCRRYLKPYEPHLANVALSNVESSRTIAQVLYDMNEGSNHR